MKSCLQESQSELYYSVTTLIQNKCIFIENLTLMWLEKNSCTHHGYFFLFSKPCLPRVIEYDTAYHTKIKICFHKELFKFKYECFFEKKLFRHKENRQV